MRIMIRTAAWSWRSILVLADGDDEERAFGMAMGIGRGDAMKRRIDGVSVNVGSITFRAKKQGCCRVVLSWTIKFFEHTLRS